jgi:hypothetical protein
MKDLTEQIIDVLNKYRAITEVGSLRDVAEELSQLLTPKQSVSDVEEIYKEFEDKFTELWMDEDPETGAEVGWRIFKDDGSSRPVWSVWNFFLPYLQPRNAVIDEVIKLIEGYFKGLVVIPDPQKTKESLIGYVYALKTNAVEFPKNTKPEDGVDVNDWRNVIFGFDDKGRYVYDKDGNKVYDKTAENRTVHKLKNQNGEPYKSNEEVDSVLNRTVTKEEIKEQFHKKFGTDTVIVTQDTKLVEPIIAVWHFIEELIENGTLMTRTAFTSEEYAEGFNKGVESVKTTVTKECCSECDDKGEPGYIECSECVCHKTTEELVDGLISIINEENEEIWVKTLCPKCGNVRVRTLEPPMEYKCLKCSYFPLSILNQYKKRNGGGE